MVCAVTHDSSGADRPVARGELDWKKIEEQRNGMFLAYDHPPQPHGSMSGEQLILVRALNNYASANLAGAWENWQLLKREPHNPIELTTSSECIADQGSDAALPYLDQLQSVERTEAQAIRARLLWRQDRFEEARVNEGECPGSPSPVDPWPMQALDHTHPKSSRGDGRRRQDKLAERISPCSMPCKNRSRSTTAMRLECLLSSVWA